MGALVKWGLVKGAYKYFLGISGETFEQILDVTNYYDPTGVVTKKYKITKTLDRIEGTMLEQPAIDSVHEIDSADYCRVHGSIVDPDGRPVEGALVEAFVHQMDFPEDMNNAYFEHPEEYTITTAPGKFQMYLRRNERFVVRAPQAMFKRWFMVPDLDDLDITAIVGTDIDIRNPY